MTNGSQLDICIDVLVAVFVGLSIQEHIMQDKKAKIECATTTYEKPPISLMRNIDIVGKCLMPHSSIWA